MRAANLYENLNGFFNSTLPLECYSINVAPKKRSDGNEKLNHLQYQQKTPARRKHVPVYQQTYSERFFSSFDVVQKECIN